jgi:hypothetical protein
MNKLIWLLPAALALPACVTINIYFPEAAAEKAADRIIEDVWQIKDQAPDAPTEQQAPADAGDE